MRSLVYLRFFRSSLELLIERGHNVRLLLAMEGEDGADRGWLDRMLERPNFACDIVDHFSGGAEYRRGVAVRRGLEYVRVLRAGHDRSTVHFHNRERRAPAALLRLTALPLLRTPWGLSAVHGVLSLLDRVLPASSGAAEYIARLRPDVLALCDYGRLRSLHSTYAKVAKELGIPVAMCVSSWDNLTSRQRLRVVPHALLVWNRRQVQEAVEIHDIPAERVVPTGAPSFDEWFEWVPRPREEFLTRVGLDPARPVILWVGGALYPSERTEAEYAAAWLAALREADDPALRGAGVLLRPHPFRVAEWDAIDLEGIGNAVVWPGGGVTMPVHREQKADFFDSIYHAAAVVGLNTSAMIEASIVGRPVLTILAPEFHDSQLGTFHFSYLLESSGGAVTVAKTPEEQFGQLGEILAGRREGIQERADRFVADFVRPNGLERPATPIFVETLERLAESPVPRELDPLWVRTARGALVLALRIRGRGLRLPRLHVR